MQKKPRLTSGAVIYTKEEECHCQRDHIKFLVIQRAKDDHFPLHWEFPRGSCDKGETMANCMMREVKEESGLDVVPQKYLGRTEYYSEKHDNMTHCHIFLAKAKSENIKINANGVHEHEQGKWLVPELVREKVLPDQRIFVDRALDYLKGNHAYQITDPSKKPAVVRESYDPAVEGITFEIYCEALDFIGYHYYLLEDEFMANLKMRHKRISGEWVSIFSKLKGSLIRISRDFSIGVRELITAIKRRSIFTALKAFGFNLTLMFKAVAEGAKALRGVLASVFKELYETKQVQKIRKGAQRIDQLLKRYPKLKMIGGVAIAGILLWMWVNMTFIGNLDYDFNFTNTIEALKGNFSIADLFVSADGLMLMALFGTGVGFGISVPWLGATAYNLVLALVYTGYYRYVKPNERKYNDSLKKLRSKIGTGK